MLRLQLEWHRLALNPGSPECNPCPKDNARPESSVVKLRHVLVAPRLGTPSKRPSCALRLHLKLQKHCEAVSPSSGSLAIRTRVKLVDLLLQEESEVNHEVLASSYVIVNAARCPPRPSRARSVCGSTASTRAGQVAIQEWTGSGCLCWGMVQTRTLAGASKLDERPAKAHGA